MRWTTGRKRRAELIAMANASSAKQVHDYGCSPNSNFAAVNGVGNSPCNNPCNSWRYNPWYGLVTYIPCGANIYSPYGYRYWSPYNVMRAFYVPPPQPIYNGGGGGGFGNCRLRWDVADFERIFGRDVGTQQFSVFLRRRRFRPAPAPLRQRAALPADTARPAVAATSKAKLSSSDSRWPVPAGGSRLPINLVQMVSVARGAQRTITAGSADTNQLCDLAEQVREVFRVDREVVASRRRSAFARGLVGSHLGSGRMIVFDTGIRQDIARHSGVAEHQRIAALVQFGKCFRRRSGNIYRISASLQNRLQCQSRCKIAMHQQYSGQVQCSAGTAAISGSNLGALRILFYLYFNREWTILTLFFQ